MKFLYLPILLSIQLFGGVEPLTAREKNTFALQILGDFPSDSQEVMREPIEKALSEINPDNAAEIVKSVTNILRNHKGAITPSYVEGVMVGINAGISAPGVHTQVGSESSTAAQNISEQSPLDDHIADDSSEQERPAIEDQQLIDDGFSINNDIPPRFAEHDVH